MTIINRSEAELKAAQRKYLQHRQGAKDRGIDFMMSYDEWQQWWDDSGHWHERGVKNTQYVMARKGDTGPYSIDNVECITAKQNKADAKANGKMLLANRNQHPAPHPYQAPTGIIEIVKPTKPPKPIYTEEEKHARRVAATHKGNETRRLNGTLGKGGRPVGTRDSDQAKANKSAAALRKYESMDVWNKGKKTKPMSEASKKKMIETKQQRKLNAAA